MPFMTAWKSVKPGSLMLGSSQNGWKNHDAKPSRTATAYCALVRMSCAVYVRHDDGSMLQMLYSMLPRFSGMTRWP